MTRSFKTVLILLTTFLTFRVKYMVEPYELQETAEIEWTTSKNIMVFGREVFFFVCAEMRSSTSFAFWVPLNMLRAE